MPAHNPMLTGFYGSQAPMSGFPQTQVQSTLGDSLGQAGRVVDGTPLRVVTLAGCAAIGIVALRYAGFKFNVTAGV